MKLILLAAVAAFASPAMAQTTTDTQAPAAAAPSDAAAAAAAAETAGGYAPTSPPMSAPAEPGAKIIFQPSVSPEQAFPPPPALDNYPPCKRGQTDNCIDRHSPK